MLNFSNILATWPFHNTCDHTLSRSPFGISDWDCQGNIKHFPPICSVNLHMHFVRVVMVIRRDFATGRQTLISRAKQFLLN